jgi:hypothetical protein
MVRGLARLSFGILSLVLSGGTLTGVLPMLAFGGEESAQASHPTYSLTSVVAPKLFSVSQNYPNPFNAATHIQYGLPEEADVQIRVYNVLGREVTRLLDRAQQPGSYVMHWNGTNDRGEVVPSGLYIVVLLANENYAVRKTMMVK